MARDAGLLATSLRAERLWAGSLAVAERCRDHPFLRGIASGELDRRAFEHYVGQDAFFLDAFERAYALCVARAPGRRSMRAFKALLDAVDEELELHAGYAERWGVELAPAPTAATRAYTDFLLRTASLEPVGHAAAAMAPCMRLYAWLGRELEPDASESSPYREWIETYGSADFERHAASLEALLDTLAVDEDVAAAHYARAMELELAFFDSAYSAPSP
jgi:thiaminase/transcriptional activator TenA